LCGAQANWQANLSPNHLSLGVKKAKEKLANAKTREQVANFVGDGANNLYEGLGFAKQTSTMTS
jgi:hypothetical protein